MPDDIGPLFATWWQRVGALVLDMLVIWVPGGLVIAFVYFGASITVKNPNGTLHTLHPNTSLAWAGVTALHLIYFATLDGQSQTAGKRSVGIAVRARGTGQPIGFGRALLRWVIFGILFDLLFVPGVANALSPLWDANRQAWHDHAVGSVVVRVR